MCSIFGTVKINDKQRQLISFVSDEDDVNIRYNMYLVGEFSKELQLQSFEDLLSSSLSPMTFNTGACCVFKRRDRLYLAASLACGVLQFHGTWLKSQWGGRDILFAKTEDGSKPLIDQLYLSWNVLRTQKT